MFYYCITLKKHVMFLMEKMRQNSLFLYYSEEAHVMSTHALFCELSDCIHVWPGVYLQKDLEFK